MPHIKICQNFETCKGVALDGDHLCQYCRAVADAAKHEQDDRRKLAELETKPRDWRDAFGLGRRK